MLLLLRCRGHGDREKRVWRTRCGEDAEQQRVSVHFGRERPVQIKETVFMAGRFSSV